MSANRAWSRFQIKNINDEAREFSGIASLPVTDRMGDVVNPLGAKFKLPLVLMWEHGKGKITDPIGWVTSARPNAAGIPVEGRFAKVDSPVTLRDDLDRCWAVVRAGLVRGLSIGFRTLQEHPIAGGYSIDSWEWLELSPVAIPACEGASITAIKAADLRSTRGSALDSREQRELLGRLSARADPGVMMARRARLLREARIDTRTTMQFFSSLE